MKRVKIVRTQYTGPGRLGRIGLWPPLGWNLPFKGFDIGPWRIWWG